MIKIRIVKNQNIEKIKLEYNFSNFIKFEERKLKYF